jgi:hypothetical protein
MGKIKAICVKNTMRDHPYDDTTETPFTIGKVYELDVYGNGKWCLVFHDEERIGHYPISLFKTLDEVRNEHLDIILG